MAKAEDFLREEENLGHFTFVHGDLARQVCRFAEAFRDKATEALWDELDERQNKITYLEGVIRELKAPIKA